MSTDPGDRTRHWPAIERRTGLPASHWLDLVRERIAEQGAAYDPLVTWLREEHGMTREHASALVLYARGSTTSRRVADLDGYLDGKDATGAATARAILDGLVARHPGTAITIAWNQPCLTRTDDGRRLFSVGVMTAHLTAAPWSVEVLDAFREDLAARGLKVAAKTFRLPADWTVDTELLDAMVAAELALPAPAGSTPRR